MENNLNNFTRLEKDQDQITIVKQMPKVQAVSEKIALQFTALRK